MKHHAFTLVELIVSLTIVAILLTLTLRGMQSVRGQARLTVCANNIRQLHVRLSTGEGWIIGNMCPDDIEGHGFFRNRLSLGLEADQTASTTFQLFEHAGASRYPHQFIAPSLETDSDPRLWFSAPTVFPGDRLRKVKSFIATERHFGGTANYLFLDGHVEAIPAEKIASWVESGYNFALPGNAKPNDELGGG